MGSSNPTLNIYLRELKSGSRGDVCIFPQSLCIIQCETKVRKQPSGPLTDEWVKKGAIYVQMECFFILKKKRKYCCM